VQVERRRAERARAVQLNMLTPAQRAQQLADELHAAMEHARAAKASGSKELKRVAGEVIKQLKQEMVAAGIKEADVRALVAAQHPPPQQLAPPERGAPREGLGARDHRGVTPVGPFPARGPNDRPVCAGRLQCLRRLEDGRACVRTCTSSKSASTTTNVTKRMERIS
jgi:hypothetical protein